MGRLLLNLCLGISMLAACNTLPVGSWAHSSSETQQSLPAQTATTNRTDASVTARVPPTAAAEKASDTPSAPQNPITSSVPTQHLVWLEEQFTLPRRTFEVRFHPDGELYVGDLISIEILAPDGFQTKGKTISVYLGNQSNRELGSAGFGVYNLGGQQKAVLPWVWDTSASEAGEHVVTFAIKPDGTTWTQAVFLQPRGQLPLTEQKAHWAHAESNCCLVYYITGTEAERDLEVLLKMIDVQAKDASRRMGTALPQPLEVTLLPRVIGNGGFADGGVTISYLDRNYALADVATIFHHELIHILDGSLGGDYRPAFFVEGLAVYLSGGHYKPEPLMTRAAGLLPPVEGCTPVHFDQGVGTEGVSDRVTQAKPEKICTLGLYIPLTKLLSDFYNQQHEVGYLEAASLIEHMVNTWGWKSYLDFYHDIHLPHRDDATAGGSDDLILIAVNDALRRHFGLDLHALEKQFLQALQKEPIDTGWVKDLQQNLLIRDRSRAYQKLYDPGVYFLDAWMQDGKLMRERGIVAYDLRRPLQPANYALETLLQAGGERLLAGDYSQTNRLVQAVTAVLTAWPEYGARSFRRNPLAGDYYALVELTLDEERLRMECPELFPKPANINGSYQPQMIRISDHTASVWASPGSGMNLVELQFIWISGIWRIMPPG